MEEKRIEKSFGRSYRKLLRVLLTAFLFAAASASAFAADDENFESFDPVLISQTNSTDALTANPDVFSGALPKRKSAFFPTGSRVTVFVTNIDLLADEDENAFRAFAEDAAGKKYRLIIEDIRPLRLQP